MSLIEDALAEVIEQSLGPDWTARDAARMIMNQLSDIGLQYADNVAISEPNEPGSFKGDIWFGHSEKRTLATHRWNGQQWQILPSELDSCLQLLSKQKDENERLALLLADCPARHSMHGCPQAARAMLSALNAADEVKRLREALNWISDRFSEAVQVDCENGVRSLNERAAKKYLADFPDTLAAIRETQERIDAELNQGPTQ